MNAVWNILILINIYAVLCLANNLTVGYAGLLNLATAATFAIGSYTAALAMTRLQCDFLVAAAAAVLVSSGFAMVIAAASLRYRRTSFALASLAYQSLILAVIRNTDLAGGPLGISGIPRPALLGVGPVALPAFWLLTTACLAVALSVCQLLAASPWALALQAARDDELAAAAAGVNLPRARTEAFVASSAFNALAGSLFATYMRYIDPSSFTLDESIFLLLALVCGGTCTTWGACLGAALAILLPEWLRLLEMPGPKAANVRNICFGVLVILLIRYRPSGLAGRYALN